MQCFLLANVLFVAVCWKKTFIKKERKEAQIIKRDHERVLKL